MPFTKRKKLYDKIEAKRKRPLIAYVTSHRSNASGQMGGDVIPHIVRQIQAIPKSSKDVDFLIVSNGGDPMVSWRVISLLRERFQRIGVLVPYAAYSAATLVALGADEILMHPYSNLGPVDPQLVVTKNAPGSAGNTESVVVASEDIRHFLEFIKSDVGITDQEQLAKTFEMVCKDVGAMAIGSSKRSAHLSIKLGERLLSKHMDDASKVKSIAEALSKSFFHHGYPVGRSEAKEMGLPVVDPPLDIEDLMWQVWESFESEMECNRAFDPVIHALNDPASASLLSPIPQLNLPAGIPEEAVQQIMQDLITKCVSFIPPIDFQLFLAAVESTRATSHYRSAGKIQISRLPNLNFKINVVQTGTGWKYSLS